MKNRLFDALKKSNADYVEIRFETDETTSLSIRGKEVDTTDVSSFAGGIVRACNHGGWGTVTFDSVDLIEKAVIEACACAKLVGKEKTELVETAVIDKEILNSPREDFRDISLQTKINLLEKYNRIILTTDPAIESSSVSYGDRMRTVFFVNSYGSYFMEERPYLRLSFSATARNGNLVQRAHDGENSRTSFNDLNNLEEKVQQTALRAVALLKAPKCEGGAQTVVLDPRLGGVFIHEAFGHLSEADFLHENPKLKNLLTIGTEVGISNLNVVDDAVWENEAGTITYDDEGVPAQKNYLIKNGVLNSHLHSRETAAKMGEAPTGNARAQSRNYSPLVRMTNTYIEPGTVSKQSLFNDIDKGIYACSCFGGQTQFEMFTFSAAYGYRIENGEAGELVRDIVLTGNVFETMKNITGIADDFEMQSGICGKGGQGVPVGTGSPHLKICNVIVGGR